MLDGDSLEQNMVAKRTEGGHFSYTDKILTDNPSIHPYSKKKKGKNRCDGRKEEGVVCLVKNTEPTNE